MRMLIAVILLLASGVLAAQQRNSAYLGCFADRDSPNRDLNGYTFAAGPMNAPICISECARRGFAYAGTQFGRHCFCGDNYGRFGASDNCGSACLGTRGESCGGAYANSVYRTGLAPGDAGPAAPVAPASTSPGDRCLAAAECRPGNESAPGQVWETIEAAGGRSLWTRIGSSNLYETRSANPAGQLVASRLMMAVDRASVLITRWSPGAPGLCYYTGQFNPARTAVAGSYSCTDAGQRWSPPQSWSASIR